MKNYIDAINYFRAGYPPGLKAETSNKDLAKIASHYSLRLYNTWHLFFKNHARPDQNEIVEYLRCGRHLMQELKRQTQLTDLGTHAEK